MSRPALNLLGQKFGRLSVIGRVKNNKRSEACFKCRCMCGNEIVVSSSNLRSGNSTSCGCLQREKATESRTTHGKTYTKIYSVWKDIKKRCNNPNCKAYPNYGGRGIRICAEWENDFIAFYNYVSKLEHFDEEGYSLDRIDNSKGYEPNNLRFATRATQNRNRRNTIMIEYQGVGMSLAEAAKKSGISYGTLLARYHYGDRNDKLFRLVKQAHNS